MTLDLSLANHELYAGLKIEILAGKPTLLSPPDEAMRLMRENLERKRIDPEEIILTGSMAIWAYLVVFHFLHGKTKRIYYEDGRGQRVLVAAHG
jgi:hypothetical protein